MGQCMSASFDVYTPPDYRRELIEKAIQTAETAFLQQLLRDLQDTRFRRHAMLPTDVIPPLCRAAVKASFLLDHEITDVHKLTFQCLIVIAQEDCNIPHLLEDITAENNTKKLFRKLVDTMMYRKGILQELACSLLASISMKDCTKIRESTLPAFLKNLPNNKSPSSDFDRAVRVILVICLFELCNVFTCFQ